LEVVIRAGSLADLEINGLAFFRETKRFRFLIIDGLFAVVGSSNFTFIGLYPEESVETNLFIEEEEK